MRKKIFFLPPVGSIPLLSSLGLPRLCSSISIQQTNTTVLCPARRAASAETSAKGVLWSILATEREMNLGRGSKAVNNLRGQATNFHFSYHRQGQNVVRVIFLVHLKCIGFGTGSQLTTWKKIREAAAAIT